MAVCRNACGLARSPPVLALLHLWRLHFYTLQAGVASHHSGPGITVTPAARCDQCAAAVDCYEQPSGQQSDGKSLCRAFTIRRWHVRLRNILDKQEAVLGVSVGTFNGSPSAVWVIGQPVCDSQLGRDLCRMLLAIRLERQAAPNPPGRSI